MRTVVRGLGIGALWLCAALFVACGSASDDDTQDGVPLLNDGKGALGGAGGGCIDKDGDGFGEGCAEGPDCDDEDDTTFETCGVCLDTREGCACEPGTKPVECIIEEPGVPAHLCKTGLRSCRDGVWTACEGFALFQ